MSGLEKYCTRLIVCLVLYIGCSNCYAASSAVTHISITKAIPCMSYSPVLQMRLKRGQPDQIKWARADQGQMSAFVWSADGKDEVDTILLTHLSDSGQCSVKAEQDRSLDWRVLNIGVI